MVLRHSIEIYDVGQSKNQKVPPATSLQTLLVEEKKRGRGEEIAADKSLYFPPTNLEWGGDSLNGKYTRGPFTLSFSIKRTISLLHDLIFMAFSYERHNF